MGFQRRGNFKTFQMQIGLDRLRGKREANKGFEGEREKLNFRCAGFY